MTAAHASVAAALCAVLAGCTAVSGSRPVADPASPGGGRISAERARAAQPVIVPGRSTKAEVRAALGEATVVSFDSGFEIWVYRIRDWDPAVPGVAEYVLLFARSGILAKSRIRLPAGNA